MSYFGLAGHPLVLLSMDSTSYLFLSCPKVLSPWLSQEGEERGLHSWLTLCMIQNYYLSSGAQ